MQSASSSRLRALACITLLTLGASCGAVGPPPRTADAEKWFQRALKDYKVGDIAEAHDSITKAVGLSPEDDEVRILAARIALARLEYAEVLRLLKGVTGSDAAGLRGRAHWYQGNPDSAADELEAMLNDPEVRDDWAKSIAKLARRGAGRQPFKVTEGFYGYEEMVRVHPIAPYFVVPVEIDGEQAFAVISTANAEVVLDSATRAEPSWITMRFGKRLEISDVPALTQDLSGISKQMGGAPIRALLGVNLLRKLSATIDFTGHQFVVRGYAPPQPPTATRVDTYYLRGGGMVFRSQLGGQPASLMVDTVMTFPVALDTEGWKKAGVDAATLKLIPEDPERKLRAGLIPMMKVGAFDVPQVPAVYGTSVADIEKQLALDIDGIVGCGMLASFRVTFGEQGRSLWLEDSLAALAAVEASIYGLGGAPAPPPAPPIPAVPGPATSGGLVPLPEPKPSAPPKAPPKAPAPKAPAKGK